MSGLYGGRKTHKTKTCADCPATIPAIGGKDRCSPCSDAHNEQRRRAYSAKRVLERQAARATHG